jgi:hypothetical protein
MALVGLPGPPIKIGGFKACPDSSSGMIDVSERFLIAQVGFKSVSYGKPKTTFTLVNFKKK